MKVREAGFAPKVKNTNQGNTPSLDSGKSTSDIFKDIAKDKEEVAEIKSLGNQARQNIQKALLRNPVTELANNPREELAREVRQIKNAAKGAFNLITKGSAEFPEDSKSIGGKKQNDISTAAQQLWKGIKKGADRVKKRVKKFFNHPEWYGKYPNFITSNLNWGVRKEAFGFPMAVGYRVVMKLTIPQKKGVVSQAYQDAINAIFVKIRGSNSGAFNYTAEDVAAYIECVRAIIGLHTNLVRDVHALNNVDPYVSKTPFGLLNLLGYDTAGINDLKDHQADYVAQLNQLKNAIEVSFPIMPDLALLERTKFVSKAILEEGKGAKSSIYAYCLDTAAEAATGSGNEGKLLEASTFGTSMSARITILNRLISSARKYVSATYSNYDTFAKIAGDIMKAYGSQGFYQLDTAYLTEKAEVIFDEYMLHQLQNVTGAQLTDSWVLSATAKAPFSMSYGGKFKIPGNSTYTVDSTSVYGLVYQDAAANVPVNTDKESISGLEAISLTRNVMLLATSVANPNYDTAYDMWIYDCHADVVAALPCYHFKSDNSGFDRIGMKTSGRSKFYLTEMAMWAQIDYSPCIQIFDDSANNSYFVPMLDIDTFALMTKDQVEIFNDTCVLSLYKTVNIQDQVNFRAVKR